MGKHKIVIRCEDCKGTGLYIGHNEKDGAAVVCTTCKGEGRRTLTYKDPKKRKKQKGVSRVFSAVDGAVHFGKDVVTPYSKAIRHFSQYGCTYEEWEKGEKPKPMEEIYCPCMYESNGKEPFSKKCKEGIGIGQLPQKCRFYKEKASCWKQWHQNND